MKIIIEHEGARLEIPEEEIGAFEFSLPSRLAEVACECPGGPCGYVHRRHAGAWRIELMAELKAQPLWKQVT